MIEKFNDLHGILYYGKASNDYLMESSVTLNEADSLITYVKDVSPPIEDCIEIGTYNGISTVVLADRAKSVHTFDIAYRDAEFIWGKYFSEYRNKIHYTVGSQKIIDEQLKRLSNFVAKSYYNFNFAFIDGGHTYKNVKHDFEKISKFCKRILFHDANMPEIKKFINEIGAKIYKKGLWMFAIYEK